MDTQNDKVAIVIGDDAVNALGLVQSLGREDVYVISVLKCHKPMLINKSKYHKEIYCIENYEDSIEVLLQNCIFEKPAVLFPAGDSVALLLEQNKEKLKDKFLFEGVNNGNSIEFYMNKQNQIRLAESSGLKVPYSVFLHKGDSVPRDMQMPCIIKPLISCLGDKRDIQIANTVDEANSILKNNLNFSMEVVVQQYIHKDYEYDMMGCAFRNGEIYIPLSDRMVKFNSKLQDTSTVSFIEPKDPSIDAECKKLEVLFRSIGYVGLFSVEFMHDKINDAIYFTEINFRNDGENSFIVHNGVNLPYLHYLDLNNLPLKIYTPSSKSKKYIWEGIHFSGLVKGAMPFCEWLTDFRGVDGFMYYYKEDKKPFYFQFINKITSRFHL